MERKSLIEERDYHIDRLTEISLELKRLTDEAGALKTGLDALPESDVPATGAVRRRRRYIARRNTQLKAEREKEISERDALIEQLKVEVPVVEEPVD
jgi:hypothetical protein